MGNGTTTLENNWVVFKNKLNMQVSDDPAIPLLGIYARETKTYVYIKPVYIYSSFIHTHWKQPSCFYQKNGEPILHPSYGILLSNNKEQTIDTCNNLDEFQEYHAER